MIIVTGAAGFIGSCLVSGLNHAEHSNLILVDKFEDELKLKNLKGKEFIKLVDRDDFFDWIRVQHEKPDYILHMGARTDTANFDQEVFNQLNLNYSKKIWKLASDKNIPLIYASSAATYGDGSLGYDDENLDLITKFQPLNPYGKSKNDFDQWVLQQGQRPPAWYGLKFFNVYGPNEYHKGRMASVVYHAYQQITGTGELKLFKSHHPQFEDGKQLRDFIYVKDLVSVILFMMGKKPASGIYNLGTGQARTFLDLGAAVYSALKKVPEISFIDTPLDIRDKYQYFTEAKMNKLRKAGYGQSFYSLENGIQDYVVNYLMENKRY